MNYHVKIDEHFYSAPHQPRHETLDARLTELTVEFFHKRKSVAAHSRSYRRGYTTLAEHMPKSHREYAEWTPERLITWAATIGEATGHWWILSYWPWRTRSKASTHAWESSRWP